MKPIIAQDYQRISNTLKEIIRQARLRAVSSVNREMLSAYREIGKTIFEEEKSEGWGPRSLRNYPTLSAKNCITSPLQKKTCK
jgi:hypothetical protein